MVGMAQMYAGEVPETFLAAPKREQAKVILLGADTATPYASVGPYCASAPAVIRAASADYAVNSAHWNFDLARPALVAGDLSDWGDVPVGSDAAANRASISEQVRRIRDAGATLLVVGGDDSVPIPVIAAMAPEPLWIVQLDAHLDWREDVAGERWGLSSTMRRASEMDHVAGLVQIGQRGVGSARAEEVAAAETWGATIIPARAAMAMSAETMIATVPAGARVLLAFDWDVLDPSIMPALIAPTGGGLGYWQMVEVLSALTARCDVVGVTACEFMPSRDIEGRGALLAAQLLTTWVGILAA